MEWLTTEREITKECVNFCRNLFVLGRSSERNTVLQAVPKLVDDKTNQELTKELTEEEVKRAVFQLGVSKAPRLNCFPGLFYQLY